VDGNISTDDSFILGTMKTLPEMIGEELVMHTVNQLLNEEAGGPYLNLSLKLGAPGLDFEQGTGFGRWSWEGT
jgi:hypothetical protein